MKDEQVAARHVSRKSTRASTVADVELITALATLGIWYSVRVLPFTAQAPMSALFNQRIVKARFFNKSPVKLLSKRDSKLYFCPTEYIIACLVSKTFVCLGKYSIVRFVSHRPKQIEQSILS